MTDPTRQLCGLAATFPGTIGWDASAFKPWLGLGLGLPLRADHGVVITPAGVTTTVGRTLDAVLIEESSTTPAGLLVLAELDAGPFGAAVLEAASNCRPGDRRIGLSLGFRYVGEDGEIESVLPTELSVTPSPADPMALTIGVGRQAGAAWELLPRVARRRGGPGEAGPVHVRDRPRPPGADRATHVQAPPLR